MENEELLNKIMDISISIARMETQQISLKEMIAGEFALIQREQISVIGKVDDMEKELKKVVLNNKEEIEKVSSKMELRVKELEVSVKANDIFKMQVKIALTLIMTAVAFGNQLFKLLGWD